MLLWHVTHETCHVIFFFVKKKVREKNCQKGPTIAKNCFKKSATKCKKTQIKNIKMLRENEPKRPKKVPKRVNKCNNKKTKECQKVPKSVKKRGIHCIDATIRTHWEIQGLPNAGFLLSAAIKFDAPHLFSRAMV